MDFDIRIFSALRVFEMTEKRILTAHQLCCFDCHSFISVKNLHLQNHSS